MQDEICQKMATALAWRARCPSRRRSISWRTSSSRASPEPAMQSTAGQVWAQQGGRSCSTKRWALMRMSGIFLTLATLVATGAAARLLLRRGCRLLCRKPGLLGEALRSSRRSGCCRCRHPLIRSGNAATGGEVVADPLLYRRMRRFISAALGLFALVPLVATLVARGSDDRRRIAQNRRLASVLSFSATA